MDDVSSYSPRMKSHEWYSKWALDNMAPCDDCPPEYREAYARLEGAVEAAESCFRFSYSLYVELSHLTQREMQ